jgi:hypothetical protein
MHAKRPESPALSRQRPPLPARAMPAQVKLASPVDPVYPVRRAGRGPAPITCLIHLPPPAVRCRVQVRSTTPIDYSPRQSGFPAWPFMRPPGTTTRPRAGRRRRPPSSHLGHRALRRPTRPTPGPGIPREYHPRVPSTDTEPPLPCQIQAGSRMRGPRSNDSAKHFQAHPARPIEPRPPTRTSVVVGQMSASGAGGTAG